MINVTKLTSATKVFSDWLEATIQQISEDIWSDGQFISYLNCIKKVILQLSNLSYVELSFDEQLTMLCCLLVSNWIMWDYQRNKARGFRKYLKHEEFNKKCKEFTMIHQLHFLLSVTLEGNV